MAGDGFKGKTVVVSGGASGVGRGIVEAFAPEGATVIVADIDQEWGLQRETELRKAGHDVTFMKNDVRYADQVAALFRTVAEKFRGVDVLVNCAGVGVHKEIVDLTEEEWDFQIDIQLKGVFLMCREAARQMIAMKRKGRLINIGSGSAVIARPNAGPHAASKAGAAHLTRVMSLELGPHGITVNTVCPGLTDIGPTSHYGGSTPDYQKNFIPEVPMGRLARPEEVADAVLFFASDKARFITGQLINIDGGYTAGKMGIRGSHKPTPLSIGS